MRCRPLLVAGLFVLSSLAAPASAGAAALPDLVVTAITAPATVEAGSTMAVGTSVKNLRGARTPSTYVRVVLSRDKVAGSTDKVLGRRLVGRLSAGATTTGKQTYTVPATAGAGAWFVVACADATKLVREYREGNNCRARALTVTRPNLAPVAEPDEFATMEEQPLVLDVAQLLANDWDPDETGTLSLEGLADPVSGVLSPLVDGAFTFTPDTDFFGTAAFSYSVSDGEATSQGEVSVLVGAVNDLPLAGADQASTTEDTAVLVPFDVLLANDSDADPGDQLTVTAVENPTHGAVALEQGGVRFTPSNGFHGVAGFSYQVSDGTGASAGTVTVDVTPGPLGIFLQQEAGSVTEGSAAKVWVSLTDPPPADVTVSASSFDDLWPTVDSLTFTPSNWSTPQELTVAALHDDDLADEVGVVWLESPGIAAVQVGWNIDDDDTQGIATSASSLAVVEGGTTTVGVRLMFRPASDVVVGVGSNDTMAATVSPPTLTFTPANWSTYQQVTVTGVQDVDLAPESAGLQLTSAGIPTASVTVAVTDDDTQQVETTVSELTVPEGASASVGVRLRFQPSTNVTVTVSSPDTSAVSVAPTTLTFTPANWSTTQPVTVTGVQDVDSVEDVVTVSLTAPGALPGTVQVTAPDDD